MEFSAKLASSLNNAVFGVTIGIIRDLQTNRPYGRVKPLTGSVQAQVDRTMPHQLQIGSKLRQFIGLLGLRHQSVSTSLKVVMHFRAGSLRWGRTKVALSVCSKLGEYHLWAVKVITSTASVLSA
jgi:hypothetical protein